MAQLLCGASENGRFCIQVLSTELGDSHLLCVSAHAELVLDTCLISARALSCKWLLLSTRGTLSFAVCRLGTPKTDTPKTPLPMTPLSPFLPLVVGILMEDILHTCEKRVKQPQNLDLHSSHKN